MGLSWRLVQSNQLALSMPQGVRPLDCDENVYRNCWGWCTNRRRDLKVVEPMKYSQLEGAWNETRFHMIHQHIHSYETMTYVSKRKAPRRLVSSS